MRRVLATAEGPACAFEVQCWLLSGVESAWQGWHSSLQAGPVWNLGALNTIGFALDQICSYLLQVTLNQFYLPESTQKSTDK